MNAVTISGKYLFGFPFIVFGILHFINGDAMAEMVPLPGGIVWVYIAGLIMLLAGVCILIERKDAIATFFLGLLLLCFVFLIHLPVVMDTGGTDALATTNLLKDLALAGAAFVYARSAARDRTKQLT